MQGNNENNENKVKMMPNFVENTENRVMPTFAEVTEEKTVEVSPVSNPNPVQNFTQPVANETPVQTPVNVSVDPSAVNVEAPKEEIPVNKESEVKSASKVAQIIGTVVVFIITVLLVIWIIRRFFLL